MTVYSPVWIWYNERTKIKQDEIKIGENIRRIRLECGVRQTELVRILQLEGIEITREPLVKNVDILKRDIT